jgi:hypothetical protein
MLDGAVIAASKAALVVLIPASASLQRRSASVGQLGREDRRVVPSRQTYGDVALLEADRPETPSNWLACSAAPTDWVAKTSAALKHEPYHAPSRQNCPWLSSYRCRRLVKGSVQGQHAPSMIIRWLDRIRPSLRALRSHRTYD